LHKEGCPLASSQEARSAAERAQEAQSLLGHIVFGEAVTQLRRTILERLLALPAGSPDVPVLHMKAKMVDEIVGELRSIANEIKFRRQKESA
jgi:hypothetical protein